MTPNDMSEQTIITIIALVILLIIFITFFAFFVKLAIFVAIMYLWYAFGNLKSILENLGKNAPKNKIINQIIEKAKTIKAFISKK